MDDMATSSFLNHRILSARESRNYQRENSESSRSFHMRCGKMQFRDTKTRTFLRKQILSTGG